MQKMPAKDWRKLYEQHKGQWVALQDDEVTVIAAAPTLAEARAKAARLGFSRPVMAKMPKDLSIFVG
jgi:hypothetical protein